MSIVTEAEQREKTLKEWIEKRGYDVEACFTSNFTPSENGQFNYFPQTYTTAIASNKKNKTKTVRFVLSMTDGKIYKNLNKKTKEFEEEYEIDESFIEKVREGMPTFEV